MQLTNFRLHEITDEKQRDELNEKLKDVSLSKQTAAVGSRSSTSMASLMQQGIRIGHRAEMAADIIQQDIQLRIRDQSWEEDSFIPLTTAADILRLVVPEIEKRTVID